MRRGRWGGAFHERLEFSNLRPLKLPVHFLESRSLTHYAAFADCPSLPALKQRFNTELPFAVDWHIHVMMSQNGLGELILGDSHEYGLTFDPFDRADINQ
jgi:hypothetical protein